jgi:transcriptional regulator of nitric oxide reductase
MVPLDIEWQKNKNREKRFSEPKTYEFVNENTSQHLKSWMRKDFILSVLKMGCLALMCIFAFLSKA